MVGDVQMHVIRLYSTSLFLNRMFKTQSTKTFFLGSVLQSKYQASLYKHMPKPAFFSVFREKDSVSKYALHLL